MSDVVESFLTADAIEKFAKTVDPVGDSQVVDRLSDLDAAALFCDSVANNEMADCCLSGLWLLHNHLHRSHEISQSIDTPEGSWWHAIMHRIEGDFSNAKYWYRRVGEHPLLDQLRENQSGFDPDSFVDQCQSEYRNGELSAATQQMAFAEWKALFDYCQQNAS